MNEQSEINYIHRIAERAISIASAAGYDYDKESIVLALWAAHDDIGLDLRRLDQADDANLAHDVFGIFRHLDPMTSQLTQGFCPRFAQGEKA